jgi:uncharacterized protein (TIGR02996 family)
MATRGSDGRYVLYVAELRDGSYGCVEAIDHRDARRYFGSRAQSVHKRFVADADWEAAAFDRDQGVLRRLHQGWELTTGLSGFLDALGRDPDDEATRAVLADYLDERGPTPVDPNRLPDWLRLAWLRDRPRPGERLYSRTGWAVAGEIGLWLEQLPRRCYVRLDHWGRTVLDGVPAFVNEPYADVGDAAAHLRPLADRLGCVLAYARLAYHGRGAAAGVRAALARVLLLPAPPAPFDEPTGAG